MQQSSNFNRQVLEIFVKSAKVSCACYYRNAEVSINGVMSQAHGWIVASGSFLFSVDE